MRHKVSGKKLGRTTNHRRSLIKNLTEEMIIHESLETTETKGKLLRSKVEKMINKAKKDTVAQRRLIASRLFHKEAVKKLFDDLAKRYKNDVGGFVTMQRIRRRRGDNTVVVKLAFKEVAKPEEVKESKKK